MSTPAGKGPISERGLDTRCPRCGGVARERRMPTARNPFLAPKDALVCSLCGLDYEPGAKPWAPTRPGEGDG